MTANLNIPRHTFLLDASPEDVVPTCITVYRSASGEIVTHSTGDNREADRFEDIVLDRGGVILCRVEGERDLSTGETSVWVR